MRHIAFFRGSRGKQLFSPCFISFAQLRRVLQNPQQITVRIKAILLRRFNQAVDHGAGLRATGRVGKEPVLPAHHKGLNAALGTVELTTKYRATVYSDRGELFLRSRIVEQTSRLAKMHVELFNADGTLGSEADVVYRIFPENVARQRLGWTGIEAFYRDEK